MGRRTKKVTIKKLEKLEKVAAPTAEQIAFIDETRSQLGRAAVPFSEIASASEIERMGTSGVLARAEREVADAASSQIVKSVTLKRFNIGDLKAVLNEPGTRKYAKGAMIAGGLLLALGALHGDKHIERTPEQMGGPPLLPGGSPYEDYSNIEDYSSMYSMAFGGSMNPGVLYKVNVSGSIEPTELQRNIQLREERSQRQAGCRYPRHRGANVG